MDTGPFANIVLLLSELHMSSQAGIAGFSEVPDTDSILALILTYLPVSMYSVEEWHDIRRTLLGFRKKPAINMQ